MAANWIRMRGGLLTNAKVIRMARFLMAHQEFMSHVFGRNVTRDESVTSRVTMDVTKRVIVGSLLPVWASINDSATTDGFVPGLGIEDVDDMAGVPGMGEAMELVEWVGQSDDGLIFRNFEEHNTVEKERSTTAKTGAQRSKEWREKKRAEKAARIDAQRNDNVTRNVTDTSHEQSREEKRREDSLSGDETSPVETASAPTAYGLCSKAMRKAGMFEVSPDHPEFRALVDAGVSPDEFASAAAEAVGRGKGFAYALATVRGRREDAARKGALPAAPDPQAERMGKFAGAL